ncbi:MAG TPA: hypothetical protein VF339_08620 [Gammaproteobacteria bacterium]
MSRVRPAVLASVLLAVGGASIGADRALAQQVGEGIRWQADRPLEWSDFKGQVDPNAGPQTAALTSASVSVGFELEVRGGRRCEFEVLRIETTAEFHPEHSWVRDGARTAAVLEHEQGHFDLAEVFRAVLERQAAALVGRPQRCAAGADPSAIEAEVNEWIAEIRGQVFDELERVQDQYDAETGHGTLPDAQSVWTARIRQALRRGSW